MAESVTGPTGVDMRVTLINAFTVPDLESERFLRRWRENARIMAAQPGFVRARMYRALDDGTEFPFVNVAEWENQAAFDRATANPEWLASVQRAVNDPDLHLTSRPAVYRLSVDVSPGGEL
ncbi:antibiotic biosynthesis monooxygenase family protein [Amycolatopsis alkalitolerans]|uniref:Antibiotic biosynthesis monooxygenase n=1 Tax=Amycolatopsis alkalitolerans TaxID=2547244 RepID=A0A5C4MB05_9PSEU|nr:antibiotic biosynthesis monooxygenase family protein [Amycolatopsis alkalitolerans]TNC29201.1 antibiotic biosynthesis monooxygenase [Amycolatopsis alkalitolerans]